MKPDGFVKKIRNFIIKNDLLEYDSRVIVCLSGGADSVCLLRVINELKEEFGIRVYAAHVNHMLRGEAADRDEKFCKELCQSLGIELRVLKKDVAKIAKQNHQSIEAAARDVRYKFFFELKKELCADLIITAHNKGDNAETSLMNYLRGSGVDGLKGIVPKRDDGVIRPLLCVLKTEIEQYLKIIGQTYVTDATNFEDEYRRNKIRLKLIPNLKEEYNSNLEESIADNALLIGLDAEYMNGEAQKAFAECMRLENEVVIIDACKYQKLHRAIALRVIRLAIKTIKGSMADISYDAVMRCEELFFDEAPKTVTISSVLTARREYGSVIFEKAKEKTEFFYEASIGERLYIEEIDTSFLLEKVDFMEKTEKNCEYFDYNPECGKIYIRSRKNGDRFKPFGMRGEKKLKDYFIDEKIMKNERDKIPLVVYGEDILWVCGMRRSSLMRVKKDSENILRISFWRGK